MRRIAGAGLCLLVAGAPGGSGADVPGSRERHDRRRAADPDVARAGGRAVRPVPAGDPARLAPDRARRSSSTTSFGAVPQLHQVQIPGRRAHPDHLLPRRRVDAARRRVPAERRVVRVPEDTAGGGEADQLFRYDLARGATGAADRRQVAQRRSGDLAHRADRLRLDASATARIATSTCMNPSRARRPARCWPRPRASGPRSTGARTRRRCSRCSRLVVRNVPLAVRVDTGEKTLLTPKEATPVRWAVSTTPVPRDRGAAAIVRAGRQDDLRAEQPRR